MKLFNTTKTKKLYIICFIVFINTIYTQKSFASPISPLGLYPEINKKSVGIENFSLNIFCLETISSKYIKAVSGSGVFLSNPDDQKNIILTNAHVARHLLDKNKTCVGRTGNPAITTHKLTLRYIPSFWLQSNGTYIIGDPNKDSTGEFDFALIESEKIKPLTKKSLTLYDIFKEKLNFQLEDYANKTQYSQGSILSYPAKNTLSKNIYNPLYIKRDTMFVKEVYSSPILKESDSLIDTEGSIHIDHGSSGGMALLQGISNNFIGLSTILIHEKSPQIVRVVTLKHIFSVIEKDLKLVNTDKSDVFIELLNNTKKSMTITLDYINILKNQKLTAILELQTKKTLQNLGIISK